MASAVKGQRKGEMNTSHRSEDEGAPILLQEPCVGVTRSQEMCHKTVWSLQDGSDMETPITWLRCSKSKSPLSASMIPRSGLVQLGEEQPYTAARIGKLTLLTFGAILKWIVWCGDVKAAFLLGVTFMREILVQLPRDCGPLLRYNSHNPVHMRMLKRAYNRLADAPLLWFRDATRRLRRLKLIPQEIDKCTFAFYDASGELKGMLILHVDDMLVAGDMSSEFGTRVVPDEGASTLAIGSSLLRTTMWPTMGELPKGLTTWSRLATCSTSRRSVRSQFQTNVAWRTSSTTLRPQSAEDFSEPFGGQEDKAYRLYVPQQVYLGENFLVVMERSWKLSTKPCVLARRLPTIPWSSRRLPPALICFCDAAFVVRMDLASQGGYVIVATDRKAFKGDKCRYSTLAWRSFKLPRLCRSSLSAESQAMASALEETYTSSRCAYACCPTRTCQSRTPSRTLTSQLQLSPTAKLSTTSSSVKEFNLHSTRGSRSMGSFGGYQVNDS